MITQIDTAQRPIVGLRSFEQRLGTLFEKAIGVKDTIWFSKTETLHDAILRIYLDAYEEP